MTHSSLTDYASRMSVHQAMVYFVILFAVIIILFLGILSMSSVRAKVLQPSQSESQAPPASTSLLNKTKTI
jgi:uncharacterized SAM-binding protein YcdF (DUF218 family)